MPRVNEEELVFETFASETAEAISLFLSTNGLVLIAVVLALFAIFTVHQFTTWLSTDPVRAFHLARRLAALASSIWNTIRTIANAGIDVVTSFIPTFNLVAIHAVQPTVFVALDVFSLVFTGSEYKGIIKDPSTFEGHVCDGTVES